MSKIAWSNSPDIKCPSCGNEFHQSDYFELSIGAEVTCSSCGKTLRMIDEEIQRSWAWEVDIDPA
jgi:endogenous inhibitor of DNA gyrase (YacG/DUF329 family)